MATLHATVAALRAVIESVTPLTDAGRRFYVAPEGHVDDTPSGSREVLIWSEGLVRVSEYLSPTTWYVAHEVHIHTRYHATRLGAIERAQATEDAAILIGSIMRPVQLLSVPWCSISITSHDLGEPTDERQWIDSVLRLEIYQEVS